MQMETNTILTKLTDILESSIKLAYPDAQFNRKDIYDSIGQAPNIEMAHYAFPTFRFAKALKQGPPQIAGAILDKIQEQETSKLIKDVKAQGPYLNFTLSADAYFENLISEVRSGNFFTKKLTSNEPKTMIEYSQPNTHKELHVGHMRNLCLGNALVRIKEYCDVDVHPVTYPGDSGTHVAKCLWYLKYHNQDTIPETNKGEWLGRIYTLANTKLEDELGSDKEDDNRAKLTEILKQLHSESGEFYDLWQKTRQWSIDLMKKTYEWADVEFERWFFESEMDAPSLKICEDYYKDGTFIKDDGAIGMDLSDDKLGFCILIKSDGTGLYSTKDVALAIKKFEEFGVEKNIYIVDSRQAFHFKQVFKVLEKIGFEQAKDCYHLPYEMVELTDGAMSSRKGNIVPLTDLINKMEAKIKEDYLNKYQGEWDQAEIDETATKIANGAIKYGMIKIDNNRKIVFDMNEWLKLDGDTGPYLQYVYARINSLLVKQGFDKSKEFNLANAASLENIKEYELMQKISLFNDVAIKAHEQNKTSLLTTYLFELGKLFNSFYAACPIASSEESLKQARLELAYATSEIIKHGLAILGIKVPGRM